MLLPRVQRLADAFVKACADQGIQVAITEGYRDPARQQRLYNQPYDGIDNDRDGRIDESDEKVTQAKAGESYHNYGVAFDIIFVVNGKRTYTGDWEKVGQIGESLGLEWGGRWTKFRDRPHFQLSLGYSISKFIRKEVDYSQFN